MGYGHYPFLCHEVLTVPKTMQAAVLEAPERLTVREILVPKINADELLVEVASCGICGSDLRYLAGENPWALHTLGRPQPNPPNIVLGHEFGGVVVEAGSDRLKDWLGARVVVAPYNTCGVCPACRTGREHLCPNTVHTGHGAGWGTMEYYPGAMARYCRAWAKRCYRIPNSLSFDEAALLDIAGVAFHALRRGEMEPGKTVCVIGTGPLGISAVRLAQVSGAKAVCAVDLYDFPLSLARKSGARTFNATAQPDWLASVLDLTDGWGVDVVLDTVGAECTLAQGRNVLAPGGTLVMLAVHADPITFPVTELGRERTMRSSANYAFADFQATVDLAGGGRLHLGDLVTHRLPLPKVREGFDLLRDKRDNGALKVLIIPGDT